MGQDQWKELAKGQKAILYTDGGCKPNPGNGGFGIHGYVYKEKDSKRGSGHPTHIPTNFGYVLKADFKDHVTGGGTKLVEIEPVFYLDIMSTDITRSTNNRTELLAMCVGLEKLIELEVTQAILFLDSKYSIARYGKLEQIEKHNWQINGEVIANKDILERALVAKRKLEEKNIEVSIEKVVGHSKDPGNDAADLLASIGVAMTMNNKIRIDVDYSPAQGYWKNDVDRHPFFSLDSTYFNTDKTKNDPGIYMLASHKKSSEALGTRMTDGSFALVQLDEPDVTLEYIRSSSYDRRDQFDHHRLMMVGLDRVFNAVNYKLVSEYQDQVLLNRPDDKNLYMLSTKKDKLFVEALEPAKFAWRAVDAIDHLNRIYHQAKEGSSKVEVTDITDMLYDVVTVKKKGEEKTSRVLNKKFSPGISKIDVKANCSFAGNKHELSFPLILSIDIPHRNSLKRLEDLNPTVKIVTWAESEVAFRYATIIEVDGARGIWAGYYSNYLFLDKNATT